MTPLVSLLLAHEKPDLLYLNMDCSSRQAFQLSGHPFALLQPFGAGTFRWCTSSDSGANWRQSTAPAQATIYGNSGVIDPVGRIYTIGTRSDIWRYDPAANAWDKVTTAPTQGALQVVIPTGAKGHMVL